MQLTLMNVLFNCNLVQISGTQQTRFSTKLKSHSPEVHLVVTVLQYITRVCYPYLVSASFSTEFK